VVRKKKYVPARGDIVWLDFDPRTGHEQSGHRPALVLSEQRFNDKTGLCLVCPITTKPKASPFEVAVPAARNDNGEPSFVLSQHVRTVDWIERRARFKSKAPLPLLREVVVRVTLILGADAGNA
jgi:mRNA interferase MazF